MMAQFLNMVKFVGYSTLQIYELQKQSLIHIDITKSTKAGLYNKPLNYWQFMNSKIDI